MDDDARLPTDLWVRLHLRRCFAEGIPATVIRKGALTGGTVILKLNQGPAGCRILTQVRDLEGRLGWLSALGPALAPEQAADGYIERALARDPDVWVLEIEDRDGRHPFEGRMLG